MAQALCSALAMHGEPGSRGVAWSAAVPGSAKSTSMLTVAARQMAHSTLTIADAESSEQDQRICTKVLKEVRTG